MLTCVYWISKLIKLYFYYYSCSWEYQESDLPKSDGAAVFPELCLGSGEEAVVSVYLLCRL